MFKKSYIYLLYVYVYTIIISFTLKNVLLTVRL